MGYTVEVRSDVPILWITYHEDFGRADAAPSAQDALKILDSAQESMIVVTDTRKISLSWDDMVYFSNKAGSPELMHHSKLLARIVITTNETSAAIAKNLDHEKFGSREMHVVASPEEALALAHQLLE